MENYRSIVLKSGLSILFFTIVSLQLALAQKGGDSPEACAGSSCTCGGSLIAGGCASGWCCKPNIANCQCSFFSNSCNCNSGNASGSMVIPTIYEQNITAMSQYFTSTAFISTESKSIAAKLLVLISASHGNNAALYFSTSEELNSLSKLLPIAEKQKANQWITSKGGTVFLE